MEEGALGAQQTFEARGPNNEVEIQSLMLRTPLAGKCIPAVFLAVEERPFDGLGSVGSLSKESIPRVFGGGDTEYLPRNEGETEHFLLPPKFLSDFKGNLNLLCCDIGRLLLPLSLALFADEPGGLLTIEALTAVLHCAKNFVGCLKFRLLFLSVESSFLICGIVEYLFLISVVALMPNARPRRTNKTNFMKDEAVKTVHEF